MQLKQTAWGGVAFFVALPFVLWLSFQKNKAQANQSPSTPDTVRWLKPFKNSDFPAISEADRLTNQFMEDWNLAGISMAVAQNGRIIFAKGYGVTDRKSQTPVQPHHRFRMASLSKLLTATAVMKLCEDEKLHLTDTVFGEQGILNHPSITQHIHNQAITRIQVHHLLAHTAGWWNKFRTDPMFIPTKIAAEMHTPSPPDFETTMRFMVSQKKCFEPGQLFDYSNFGYEVLGQIIEQKTGMPYEKYIQNHILTPLGIRMNLSKNSPQKRGEHEVMYYDYQDAPKKLAIDGTNDSLPRTYGGNHIEGIRASGGWAGSASDIIRLALAIDGKNVPKDLISGESVKIMTAQTDVYAGKEFGWRNCNEIRWLRTGSLAGTSAILVHQPNGLTWVFLTNSSTWRAHRFTYNIRRLMKQILPHLIDNQILMAQK